jgi:hypothetical protein
MGAKFGGCGISRESAASETSPVRKGKRGLLFGSCRIPKSDSIYDSEFDLNPEGATVVTGFVDRNVMDPNKSPSKVAPHSYSGELLGRDETCPLCGKDNQCRVAKGHPYKGLCWCDQIVVPGHS